MTEPGEPLQILPLPRAVVQLWELRWWTAKTPALILQGLGPSSPLYLGTTVLSAAVFNGGCLFAVLDEAKMETVMASSPL